MRPVLDRSPLAESVKSHFDGRAPWLDIVVDHPDLTHQHYDQMNSPEALERANIPIFLVGGWYDVFARQTTEQYARLSKRNTNVALTMGPWNHLQVGIDSRVYQQSFDWLEEHIAKRKQIVRKSPLQYFVTGAQEWREGYGWPPQTSQQVFHLYSSGKLQESESGSAVTSLSTFTFDSMHPTPTMGGNLLLGGGSADDTALASRSDVFTFTSEALEQNLEVMGKTLVELTHTSDTLNTDLFVRFSEVHAKGRSHAITDTCVRLGPDRGSVIVVLHLRDCAHRFAKGSKIRLIVAGASHPQFDKPTEKAVHTIHHGNTGISKVILPVAA
ncbi:galactose-binding like protein [Setomelanomma holmii]|uniref:Galactose-binding like protein n=1 Tax=Setomelanomma holmii TaxID=210430 RepID=A0A9P4LKS0_9PLEO|nr:galactose-binding like protein [Setomelanomma holmii]